MWLTFLCHLTLASGINLILSYVNDYATVWPLSWRLYPKRFMLGLKVVGNSFLNIYPKEFF